MTSSDSTPTTVEISTADLMRNFTRNRVHEWGSYASRKLGNFDLPVTPEIELTSGKPVLSFDCPRSNCDRGRIEVFAYDPEDLEDGLPAEDDSGSLYGKLGCIFLDHKREDGKCEIDEHMADFLLQGFRDGGGLDFERVQLERALSGGVEWLIPNVMETGKLASLFGPPKAGKSLLALQWAVEAISEWSVVYLDEENDPGEVVARLEAMGIDLRDARSLDYRSFTGWTVDTQEGADAILKACEGADLVIFDSWAKFFAGASQNDDAAANRAYNLTIKPLRKKGVGILRLDHSGHGEVTRPAGSVQKLADVDHNWQIKAKALGGGRAEVTLVHRDNRTNRGPGTINLVREIGPLRHVERGQEGTPEVDESTSDDPVTALVTLMDEKGWPTDWPVRTCREELQKLGQGVKQETLAAAVKARKANGVTTV